MHMRNGVSEVELIDPNLLLPSALAESAGYFPFSLAGILGGGCNLLHCPPGRRALHFT